MDAQGHFPCTVSSWNQRGRTRGRHGGGWLTGQWLLSVPAARKEGNRETVREIEF